MLNHWWLRVTRSLYKKKPIKIYLYGLSKTKCYIILKMPFHWSQNVEMKGGLNVCKMSTIELKISLLITSSIEFMQFSKLYIWMEWERERDRSIDRGKNWKFMFRGRWKLLSDLDTFKGKFTYILALISSVNLYCSNNFNRRRRQGKFCIKFVVCWITYLIISIKPNILQEQLRKHFTHFFFFS